MDRFPSTGVSLETGARVVVVPDEGGVGTALAERLEKRGVDVLLADPSIGTRHLLDEVEGWRQGGALTGLYWLPALDPVLPAELAEPEDRQEALRRRVKALHALAQVLYETLNEDGCFLVAGVRLGGRHGYDAEGALDAAGGAVSGFTKAFARERPTTLVKVVDFKVSRKTAALADTLIAETLHDPGVLEVGHADERRWAVGLEERPVEPGADLPRGGVYVVTGAAGSIVSAILTDLADGAGTFWLLDKALQPDPTNPDLDRIVSDREGLKRDLFARLKAGNERVTPVQVEGELARIEREAAALAAVQAIEDGGGVVHYRCLDLRDPEAVTAVTKEIGDAHDQIDVLLHAAGLEISRALPDKSAEEFALVFDVKVEGWYNLMTGLAGVPLGSVMTFSSIAGRFGNAGQTDYAAANDLLCKAISGMARSHPETRALSVDWTAWRDIGMAARGSIPTIMKQAGIDMLDPRAGIAIVRRELTAGTHGEVGIAEGLGVMLAEDPGRATLHPDLVARSAGPMTGRVTRYGRFDGLVVETELDPRAQPFLDHHRIDGIAVLPGVMGIEAMAEAARLPFPELHVASLEDVAFHAPFKFYRDDPRTLKVHVIFDADGEDIVADCRLSGERTLVGRDEPEHTLHFTGRVRMRPGRPEDGRVQTIPGATDDMVGSADIYDTYFHGPAYQVLDGAWRSENVVAGLFAGDLPANHEPADQPLLAAPRLIELAFQTAGLVEIASTERMGLPRGFDRLELVRAGEGEVESAAVARASGQGVFDVDVADAGGQVVLSLKGYRTSALPGNVSAGVFKVLKV
jgi:NAD(P)-dependent dehydrogenase (short-subunit alcohol dehydrogenase family)